MDEILNDLSDGIIVYPEKSKDFCDNKIKNLPHINFVKENYEVLVKLKKTKYLNNNNLKPLYLY